MQISTKLFLNGSQIAVLKINFFRVSEFITKAFKEGEISHKI